MTDFHEVQFSPDISWNVVGGPGYPVDIIRFPRTGKEVRIKHRDVGLGEWNAAKGIKTAAEMDAVVIFWRERRGNTFGFRWKDHTDFTLNREQIGTGDGAETLFNVIKTYGTGINDEIRRINKLVVSPIDTPTNMYLDDVLDPLGNWTIDFNNGTADRTAGAPAGGVTIKMDGEFDVPVRFDVTGVMDVILEDFDIQDWADIPVIEIIPHVAP